MRKFLSVIFLMFLIFLFIPGSKAAPAQSEQFSVTFSPPDVENSVILARIFKTFLIELRMACAENNFYDIPDGYRVEFHRFFTTEGEVKIVCILVHENIVKTWWFAAESALQENSAQDRFARTAAFKTIGFFIELKARR